MNQNTESQLNLGFDNLIVWAENKNYFGCRKEPDNRSKYLDFTSDSQENINEQVSLKRM